jgi:hypothetical protein
MMDIKTYFLTALTSGAYKRRSWVLSLFSLFTPGGRPEDYAPYLVQRDTQGLFYTDPVTEEKIYLREGDTAQPLLSPKQALTLLPGELANVVSKVDTTYGNALVNMQCLIDPLGDRIEFQTGRFNLKSIETRLAAWARDDKLDVEAYLRFCNNVTALSGLTQVTVTAASRQTLTGDPDRFKLREELLEKYKDRLDDPSVIATIDAELEKMDREWIANSPSAGFYTKDKSFSIVRKRLYYMLGAEQQKDSTKLHLTATSLSEGINIDDLPAMLTTQRLGAFNRGANTALGGESVKFYLRAFQNSTVAEEDCKSTLTLTYPVSSKNYKEFIGFFELNAKKEPVLIDEARAKNQAGKTLSIRTPIYCKTSGANVCVTCMGEQSRNSPKALGELAAAVGSQHMLAMMGSVHGSALKLADYDPFQTLS